MFIDDATGRMTTLRFVPVEMGRAYLEALRDHARAHGCPLAFYSDRPGIFRVNAKDAQNGDGKTEFKIPEFDKTPPIGFAVTSAPNELQGHMVVPAEVLKAACTAADRSQARWGRLNGARSSWSHSAGYRGVATCSSWSTA